MKPYVNFDYNCDNGQLAQIIIPRDATKDDLCALREILEVLIKRKFKESEVAERREDIENSPVDCSTPSVTDSKGERNEQR